MPVVGSLFGWRPQMVARFSRGQSVFGENHVFFGPCSIVNLRLMIAIHLIDIAGIIGIAGRLRCLNVIASTVSRGPYSMIDFAVMIEMLLLVGFVYASRTICRLDRSIRQTTLFSAWLWAIGAICFWTICWATDQVFRLLSESVADHLWYACSIVSLCPFVAVLGSRRPGTRVWTWFILLPMLLVLGWPVITLLLQQGEVRGLQLETPQVMAYLLVLLMGAGNYWGTRFTLTSLLCVASCSMLVLSFSQVAPAWLSDRNTARLWSSLLLLASVLIAPSSRGQVAETMDRFDLVWLDFFDSFGVVWGRRIQDRVNHIAHSEGWPARLELHGFEWQLECPDPGRREAIEVRIEHTLRWLLRRFVDPPWIDTRLKSHAMDAERPACGVDS